MGDDPAEERRREVTERAAYHAEVLRRRSDAGDGEVFDLDVLLEQRLEWSGPVQG